MKFTFTVETVFLLLLSGELAARMIEGEEVVCEVGTVVGCVSLADLPVRPAVRMDRQQNEYQRQSPSR